MKTEWMIPQVMMPIRAAQAIVSTAGFEMISYIHPEADVKVPVLLILPLRSFLLLEKKGRGRL